MRLPLLLTLVLLTASLAHAQGGDDFETWPGAQSDSPDAGTPVSGTPSTGSEWVPFPGEKAPEPIVEEAAPPPLPPPPPSTPSAPAPSRSDNLTAEIPTEQPAVAPNTVSVFGARPLERGNRAAGLAIGFPLLSARAIFGVSDRLDLGVGFDSFYGLMNEPRVLGRFLLASTARVHFAAKLEAGWAHFVQAANTEGNGARWLTGRRNYNVSPGVVLSFEGDSPRSPRFFFDLAYNVAVDTEPYQKDPLAGIPGPFQLSGNVPVRGGVEIPFSALSSFLVQLGFDLHGRADDSAFMPHISVGLVTSL